MDIYDLSRWVPIKAETFVWNLADIALNAVSPSNYVQCTTEHLPDGRMRVALTAEVTGDAGRAQEPFLIILYNPETLTSHTFVRTDVTLTDP